MAIFRIIIILILLPFFACGVLLCLSLWWWISDKNSGKTKTVRICASVLILLSLLQCGYVFLDNIFILDSSARFENDVLIWKDTEYLPASGYYSLDDLVAKTQNGAYIYEVKGDEDRRFIVLDSSYGDSLYAKKGVFVDCDGDITQIALDGVKYKNSALLKAIESIRVNFSISYVYNDNKPWLITEDKELDELCIYYDGCPVGIRTHDYVGKLNGEYVYARRQSNDTVYTDDIVFAYDIFVLNPETAKIISEYI